MSALDELRQRFDSVDEARSGLIGYDGLCKLYDGAEKTDIDQLMHYLDVDGDGKVHRKHIFSLKPFPLYYFAVFIRGSYER